MKAKRIVAIVIPALIIAAVCSVWLFVKNAASPVNNADNAEGLTFEIESGTTVRQTAALLKKSGIIKNADIFYLFARNPKIGKIITGKPESVFKIKKGFCNVNSAMDLGEIFEEVSAGKQQMISVSIPEGLTVTKVASRLEAAKICDSKEFLKVCTHEAMDILKPYGFTQKVTSLEGFLYPETYYFVKGSSPRECAELMVKTFFKKFSEIKNTDLKDTQSLYKQLVLASVVEREYRDVSEAPLIASVFKNRIKINMGLESCATVEYIITEIRRKPHPGRIFFSDLEYDSPYNTYKYAGLPPTPICSPGFTALDAVYNSADTDYLYFTLTDASKGRHTFTSTLAAHEKATQEFRTKKAAGE